jgi:methylmalonyl-CoA mutase C-terminal domain/subunit
VLLAKLGLDSHTIGVTVIARALRDAGMEVIYSGLKQTPEMVAATAIQEDVDVVGLSSLSAAHMQHFPRVVELLREQGADDKLVIAGGVIPAEDATELRRVGVARIFTMGTSTDDIVAYIRNWAASR